MRRDRATRTAVLALATVVLALATACASPQETNVQTPTLDEGRDGLRAVADLVVLTMPGDTEVSGESVTPAEDSLTAAPTTLRYELALRTTADADAVVAAAAELAAALAADGWTVEEGPGSDSLLRAGRDGFTIGVRGGGDRTTASTILVSPVITTPDGMDPVRAGLPFPPYTPPS